MKYAIVNQFGGINRISDTEPQTMMSGSFSVQITDDQATLIESGRTSTPPVLYAYYSGSLMTRQEVMAAKIAARPPIVPKSVPLWAFRSIVEADGLLPSIYGIINGIPDPAQKAVVTTFMEYGNFIYRDSPTLLNLAQYLNKSSSDIDDVFVRAGKLTI